MTKRNLPAGKAGKIIYWIATCWLALGMVSSGAVQLLKVKEETDMFTHLGYPVYLLTILGACKMLGVVAVLLPAGRRVLLNLLREWAYAGFFFTMLAAVFSHIAVGDGVGDLFGPSLLLVLTMVSWYFRPADRKIVSVNP